MNASIVTNTDSAINSYAGQNRALIGGKADFGLPFSYVERPNEYVPNQSGNYGVMKCFQKLRIKMTASYIVIQPHQLTIYCHW